MSISRKRILPTRLRKTESVVRKTQYLELSNEGINSTAQFLTLPKYVFHYIKWCLIGCDGYMGRELSIADYEGCRLKNSLPSLGHYPFICLKRKSKTAKLHVLCTQFPS